MAGFAISPAFGAPSLASPFFPGTRKGMADDGLGDELVPGWARRQRAYCRQSKKKKVNAAPALVFSSSSSHLFVNRAEAIRFASSKVVAARRPSSWFLVCSNWT